VSEPNDALEAEIAAARERLARELEAFARKVDVLARIKARYDAAVAFAIAYAAPALLLTLGIGLTALTVRLARNRKRHGEARSPEPVSEDEKWDWRGVG
jgi:hypothetical protein